MIQEEKTKEQQKWRLTEKVRDEISRDLKRTFTCDKMRTEEGQQEMKRVLEAIGYCLLDIGYCQGMNFIASTLIGVLEDEELAFWIFMNLLLKRDMRTLFLPVRFTILEKIYQKYRVYRNYI